MSLWDITLIVAVSIMGAAVAYLPHPGQKAFVLMLPIPFTLASLSLWCPIDASNVLATGLLFCFSFGVWALHVLAKWPIVLTIATCALGYVVAGTLLAKLPLQSDFSFWWATVGILSAATLLAIKLKPRREPNYRTPLPLWIKLPAIAVVITCLVLLKKQLGGFMTVFPMVGTIAAYEARHSLWTIVCRIPWVSLTMVPAMVAMRLVQNSCGLPLALVSGWIVFLFLLWSLRHKYSQTAPPTEAPA